MISVGPGVCSYAVYSVYQRGHNKVYGNNDNSNNNNSNNNTNNNNNDNNDNACYNNLINAGANSNNGGDNSHNSVYWICRSVSWTRILEGFFMSY